MTKPLPQMFAQAVNANIKAEIARRDVKAADLADALGMSHDSINRRTAGRKLWTLPEVEAVAAFFEIRPEKLTET